jgi:NarL family two-component system sensor histidine kinase YdfH
LDNVLSDNGKILDGEYNESAMDNPTGISAKLRAWLKNERETKSRAELESWPFLAFVTLVLLLLFTQVFNSNPSLRVPGVLIPTFGLVLVKMALYWFVGLLPEENRWRWGYLLLQTGLGLALIGLTQDVILVIGLFAPLIGLSVGMFRDRRQTVVAILFFVAVSAGLIIWLLGTGGLLPWIAYALPALIFVVVYVGLYTRQAEAREKAQSLLEDLQEAHLQLAAYATQVEDLTLAAERQRMARELHDTLAQGLAGLILQLEAINSHLETGDPVRGREIVRQAMGRARATLAEARAAITDLREVSAGDAELETALLQEVERFTRATGIPCDPEIDLPEFVPDSLSEHIQRIVAESLANVAQHAQAGRVGLHITHSPEDLQLAIQDDGVGFEVSEVARAGHYGLVGMRERARLAGGGVTVLSTPREGTTLLFTFPLAENGND